MLESLPIILSSAAALLSLLYVADRLFRRRSADMMGKIRSRFSGSDMIRKDLSGFLLSGSLKDQKPSSDRVAAVLTPEELWIYRQRSEDEISIPLTKITSVETRDSGFGQEGAHLTLYLVYREHSVEKAMQLYVEHAAEWKKHIEGGQRLQSPGGE